MPKNHFMKLAIEKAYEGLNNNQTPFGACLVKNGRVIACEHNAVWKTGDITCHAEIHVIRTACLKLKTVCLKGCQIYSTCEPCPMCLSACHWAKISEIYYGTGIADAKKLGFNELTISIRTMKKLGRCPVKIRGGILKKENLALFEAWAKLKNKRVY
jgi:guanine deaminase